MVHGRSSRGLTSVSTTPPSADAENERGSAMLTGRRYASQLWPFGIRLDQKGQWDFCAIRWKLGAIERAVSARRPATTGGGLGRDRASRSPGNRVVADPSGA